MENISVVEFIVTIVIATLGSSGFWAWIMKRGEKKNLSNKILMGLARERVISLGMQYLAQGCITKEEYEILCELYTPYTEMGGNGLAKKIMSEVEHLPTKTIGEKNGSQ